MLFALSAFVLGLCTPAFAEQTGHVAGEARATHSHLFGVMNSRICEANRPCSWRSQSYSASFVVERVPRNAFAKRTGGTISAPSTKRSSHIRAQSPHSAKEFRVSRGQSPWGPPLEGRVWEGSKMVWKASKLRSCSSHTHQSSKHGYVHSKLFSCQISKHEYAAIGNLSL